MNVIDGEAGAWRDVKTTADSIHFHITVDLTALRERVLESFSGLVILALLNVPRIRRGPLFAPVGLPYVFAAIATSADETKFYKCVQ